MLVACGRIPGGHHDGVSVHQFNENSDFAEVLSLGTLIKAQRIVTSFCLPWLPCRPLSIVKIRFQHGLGLVACHQTIL